MNREHYLNYAVYMTANGNYLVKVEPGYFASDAFMKSDEAYSSVSGSKFGGIFGDDGKRAHCDKREIRRLVSDEEFDRLYAESHLYFKVMILILNMLNKVHAEHKQSIKGPLKIQKPDGGFQFTADGIRMIKEYHKISEFSMYAHAWFDDLKIDCIPDEEYLHEMAECVLR